MNDLFRLIVHVLQPMKNVILKSEPGFEPAIDAEIVGNANDYIHNDPDGKHMRLNAHGVVKYSALWFPSSRARD